MPHRVGPGELSTPELPLDGGINFLDQTQVKPTQHIAGRNWWRDLDGVVRPRAGNRVWNAASLGASFDGLWEYRRQSDQVNRLIALAGGALFKGDDATQTFAQLLTGFTAGSRGYGVNAQDLFWLANGKETPRVTDGTDVFRIGIVPPAAAPTVALVTAAGNLPAEDHYYRVTYVREEAGVKVRESNPSPESTKVTNDATHGKNDVTVVASADSAVTHIYIYRRSSSTVPAYKFVAKVTNTNQTYTDNIAVSALGGFGFWIDEGGSEDHGYPPDVLWALTLHRDGRLYGWGTGSRVHYTRTNQLHYWPGSGSVGTLLGFHIVVNPDDGDEGQAILSEADDLWLLKRFNVYRLIGDGPAQDEGLNGSWRIEQVATRYGCMARASAAIGPAGAFWLSDAGPVRVDERSGQPRRIGDALKPWLRKSTDLTKAVGWVWEYYYCLFVPVTGGKMEGMVYDARNGSWWPFLDMDVQAMVTRESGDLLWGGILEVDKPFAGVVYEYNKQVTDNGRVVTAELTTRLIDAAAGRWKLMRELLLSCEANPGSILTGRVIPDASTSYVERELKLASAMTGTRMLKSFTGTKQLQGNGFSLYLKSANLTKRPAIYWWQQRLHTFNRKGFFVSFTAVYTDPDPTIGIVDGDFTGGTHTNTQIVNGVLYLADETTWVLAYSGTRANAKELYRAQHRLVALAGGGPKGGPTDTALRVYVYDGSTWSEVVAAASGYHAWRSNYDDYEAQHMLVLGNAVFVTPAGEATGQKVRRSTDLVSFVDYGSDLYYLGTQRYAIGLYKGQIWVINVFETVAAKYDTGTWISDGDPGGAFPREYTTLEQYRGDLYAITHQGAPAGGNFRKWNGTAWSGVAVPAGTLGSGSAVLRYFTVTDRLYLGSLKIQEWNGTAFTERADFGGSAACRALEEVIEPTGRHALYAAVDATVYRSYDGVTWTLLGTFAGGKVGMGVQVYNGRRYVVAWDGDVYSSLFFKTSGTYRTGQYDLSATKTSAQVFVTATVPSGTTLRTRLGYAEISGGPYTFTEWKSQVGFTVPINGRYLVAEFELTGDGTVSPAVDQVEIIAK